MGTVRKTITLTEQQDCWIKAQTSAGHYSNDSEYIRVMYCAAPAYTTTLARMASHQSAPACTNKNPKTVPSGT